MAITEETRYQIYEAFRATHGDEVANGLMDLLPPVGWADVATKHDLDLGLAALEGRIALRFELVEKEFAVLRHELGERLERALRRQAAWFTGSLFAGLTLFGVIERLIA